MRHRGATRPPLEVLVVEDNRGDARLIADVLRGGRVQKTVRIAENGEQALAFLLAPGGRRPDLVILDLNLPRMDGREVLAELRAHDALRRIPVVVLTTSSSEEDIAHAYGLRANCYVVKPHGLDEFTSVIADIERFWLSVAALPGTL